MIRWNRTPAAVACVAVLLAGCGDKGGPGQVDKQPTVPVSGIVTFKGKPLGNAAVRFFSLDGKTGAGGTSDAAGTFVVSDGLPPGKYKVVVAVSTAKEIEPGVLAPEPEGGFKSPIPMKYANPATTDLPIQEVKESGKNELVIEIK